MGAPLWTGEGSWPAASSSHPQMSPFATADYSSGTQRRTTRAGSPRPCREWRSAIGCSGDEPRDQQAAQIILSVPMGLVVGQYAGSLPWTLVTLALASQWL